MSRWGLGRRPRGRHALGAAVTELPSAPARVVAAVPRAAVSAQPVPSAEALPDVATALGAPLGEQRGAGPVCSDPSDAELEWLGLLGPEPARTIPTDPVAPGEAQPEPPAPAAVLRAPDPLALDPLDAAVPLASLPVMTEYADLLDASRLWAEPGTDWQAASPAFGEPSAPLGAADPLQAVLVESGLVPEQPGPRVLLGFRDGTTTSLAADSVQSLALEELASLLTRRD